MKRISQKPIPIDLYQNFHPPQLYNFFVHFPKKLFFLIFNINLFITYSLLLCHKQQWQQQLVTTISSSSSSNNIKQCGQNKWSIVCCTYFVCNSFVLFLFLLFFSLFLFFSKQFTRELFVFFTFIGIFAVFTSSPEYVYVSDQVEQKKHLNFGFFLLFKRGKC